MRRHWTRNLVCGLLAACLLSEAGCLSCCHPIAAPEVEQLETCQAVSKLARQHVYVFLLNGIDPVCFCNLAGVHDYLIQLGFTKVYYGELYHVFWFNKEIRKIHKEDDNARIVLVGHGLGANLARSLARDLNDENIPINLLVYVDGNTLTNPDDRSANVEKAITVLPPGWPLKAEELDDTQNVHIGGSHFSAPTDRQTLDVLTHELMELASAVPVKLPEQPTSTPPYEMTPTPRPVTPTQTTTRDEWDFLKPSSTLSSTSPVQYPPPVDVDVPPEQDPSVHTTLKPKQEQRVPSP
jgi:hypothetical protein